jgi:hypothetical protein
MRTVRILAFGSRGWADLRAVDRVLLDSWHDATQLGYEAIEVVEGTAPGADDSCGAWAERHRVHGVRHRPVAADWDGPCRPACRPGHRRSRPAGGTWCPSAGGYRNQDMVNLRPAAAVMFILPCTRPGCRRRQPHDSHGSADCRRRCLVAGVPVRRVPP